MAHIDRHTPGSFNWFELATTDQAAAKVFYGNLFGWDAVDNPIGPGELYTMFKLGGEDSAGAYTLRPDARSQAVLAQWDIYVAVESADETADRIESFGGKVVAPPFDVMDHGRMAVAADPTGAMFRIWQAAKHIGSTVTQVDGTVCWAELITSDPEAASLFYQGVFSWQVKTAANDPSGYLFIGNGARQIGGIPPANNAVPAHWLLTFATSDVEVLTNKAGTLGGHTVFPVTEIPGMGKFSILQDPQGAAFALFQSTGQSL